MGYLTLKLNEMYNIRISQVYAPTSIYNEDDIESFYEDVSSILSCSNAHYTMLVSGFNAKVGNKLNEEEIVIGHHVVRDTRGEK